MSEGLSNGQRYWWDKIALQEEAMRAALLWLAEQFEPNKALRTSIKVQDAPGAFSIKVGIEDDISAAIRAAAGGE